MRKILGCIMVSPVIILLMIILSLPLYISLHYGDWLISLGVYGTFIIAAMGFYGVVLLSESK